MATQKTRKEKKPLIGKRSFAKLLVTEFVLLFLLVAGLVGGLYGYRDGVATASQVKGALDENYLQELYQLGVLDYEAGRYDLARQRFEYIRALAPGEYPAAQEHLQEILAILNATATITPVPLMLTSVPTLTLTPTHDPSGEESIFQRAQTLMGAGNWDGAMEALLALRTVDLYYRVAAVDDTLFAALRNRGEYKILIQGDLEGGIYDLTLAEKFGPLDYRATVYRDWARLYLTALGFWQAYPQQAVYYFGQIAAAAPGLQDGGGWSARERYRASLLYYGDALVKEEKWCEAQVQYETALALRNQPDLIMTIAEVGRICWPPTQTFTPAPLITVTQTITTTISPGSSTPTITLTPEPVTTQTPSPTAPAGTISPTSTETFIVLPSATASPLPFPSKTPTPIAIPSATNTAIPYP